MPPVLNTGNSNSVIQQNIDSLKITNPEIYEKYKNDPKTLVYMANSFLEVAKDPEMTALEELEAPSSSFKTSNFRDNVAGGLKTYIQQRKDTEEFGEDYALDQRAKSLAAVSRAQKDPTTTLFDDGNKVPSAYTEPVLYNSPEENMGLGNLDKVEEPPLLADFTSPMPTGARLDPYMDIPNVKQDDPIDDMVAGENLYSYTPTPDGHHRMPDGSIMPDSEMPVGARLDPYMEIPTVEEETAVLTNKDNKKVKSNNNGILNTDTTSSNDRKGSAVSANARGSMMPYAKIDRNEALIRIGGAMVGGSSQGYTNALKAATAEYGNIQDANRVSETDAFNKAEATRLAEERIAALKAKADAKNAKTPNTAAMQYGMAALNAIDRIEALVNAEQKWVPWDNTTGLIGNLMKSVPASAANDVLANIKTIEAAVGFDRLQAMRDASPTGGALGQVSNIELDLLKSSLGNLNQSQSKEQFMMNLKQVQKVYNEIVHTDIHNPNSKNTVKPNDSEYTDDEMKYLNS
jgi:hypothetical protein